MEAGPFLWRPPVNKGSAQGSYWSTRRPVVRSLPVNERIVANGDIIAAGEDTSLSKSRSAAAKCPAGYRGD